MQAPAGPDPVGSYQLQRTSSLGDVRKNVIERVQHQFERLRRAASESGGAPNAKKLRTDTRTARVHDLHGRKTGKRNGRTAKLSLDQIERCVAQLDDNFNAIVDAARKKDEDLDLLEQKTKIIVELTAGNGLETMKARAKQAVMETEKMSALLTKATHLELTKRPTLAAVMPVVKAAQEAIRKHKETVGDEEQVKALEWKMKHAAQLRNELKELEAKDAALVEELVHVRSKQLGGHLHEELTKYVNKHERLCASAGQDDNGENPPKFGQVVKMVEDVHVECARLREGIVEKKARLAEVRKLVEEKKARKAERKRKLLADVDEWKAKLAAAEKREDEIEHAINVTDEKLAHGKEVQQEHELRRRKAEMLMKLNSQLRQQLGKNADETLAKFLVDLEKQATEDLGAAAAEELVRKFKESSEACRNRILSMKPDDAVAKVATDMEEETRAILERVIQKETVSEGEFAELNSVLIDLAEEATGRRLQALESQLEEVLDPWRKLLEKAKFAASEQFLKRMDEVEAKYEANMKDSQAPSMDVMVDWVKEKKLDQLVTKVEAKIDILRSCYEDLGRTSNKQKGSALEAATLLPIVAARERIREKLARRIEEMETHVRKLADFLPTVCAKLEADEASSEVLKEEREKELAQASVKLEESQAGIADFEARKQQLQSTLDSVVSECKEYEDRIADGERIIENNRRRDEAYRLLVEAKKRKAAEAEKRRQELLARKEDDEREIETLIQLLEELKEQEKVELREIDETANKVREAKLEEGKLQVESAKVQRIAADKLAELSKESVKHEVRRTFYEERVKEKEERKQGLKKKREEILTADPKLYFERFQGLTVAALKKKNFEAHVRLANIRAQLIQLDETEQKERKEFDRLLEHLDYQDGAVTSAKVNRKKLRAQGRALKKKLAEAEASVARDLTLRREELDIRSILELHEAKYSGMTLEEALERERSELDSVRARMAKVKLAIKKLKKKKILGREKKRKLKRGSARSMGLKASRTNSRSCGRTPQIKRSSEVMKFKRRIVTSKSKTKPPSKLAARNQRPKFSRNISKLPSKLAQSAENSNTSRSEMELPSKLASCTKPISIVGTEGPVESISSDQQTSVFTSAMEQKCRIIGSQPVDAASARIVQPTSVTSNQGNEGSSVVIEEPAEAPRNAYQKDSLSSKKEWLPESLKCIQKGESSRSKATQPLQAIASTRRNNGLSSSSKMEQPSKVATSYQNAGISSSSTERKSNSAGGDQETGIVTKLPSQCVVGEQQVNRSPSKAEQPPKIVRSNSRKAKQQVRFSSPLELPTPELKAEPPKPLLERKNSGSSSWKLDQRKKNIWYFESDDDYQPTSRKNSASSNQRVVVDPPGRDEGTRASRGRSVERKEKGLSDGRDARGTSAGKGNDVLEKAKEKAKMKPENEQGGRKSRLRSMDRSEPGSFAFQKGEDKAKETSMELKMGVGGETLKENPGKTEEAKDPRSHMRKKKETCLRDGAIAGEPSKEGLDRKGSVVGEEKANGESEKAGTREELVPGSKDRTGENWPADDVEKDKSREKCDKVPGSALLQQNATGILDTNARVRVGREVDKRTKSSAHGRAKSTEQFSGKGRKDQHPSTVGVVGQDGMKAKAQIGGSRKAEEEIDRSMPNVVVAKANGKLESKASTGLPRSRDTQQSKEGAEALRAREKASEKAGPSKRENVGKPGTRNVGRTIGAKPADSCISTGDRPKGRLADSDWKPLTGAKGKEAEKRKLEEKKSATPSASSGWKISDDDDAVPETPRKMRKKREMRKASTPSASSSWTAFDSDSQKTKHETEGEKKKQDPKKAGAVATTSRWKAYDDDDPRAANSGGGASARVGTSGSKKEDGEKKVKKTHGLLTLRNPEKVVFDMSMSDVEPDKEPVIDWSKF